MKIFKFIAVVLLGVATSFAQLNRKAYPSGSITTSGGVIIVLNDVGGTVISFELVINGSPATLTSTIQGCMRGGTCDAVIDTYSGTSNSIRKVVFPAIYDEFAIQASWTGGTSPSVTINPTTTNGTQTASILNIDSLAGSNAVGAALVEKALRTGTNSNPAAGSQATTTRAAVVGVRHVADCVGFSAAATTAPALTAGTINLRDGATGAGTILHSWQVAFPASTGVLVPAFEVCGLAIPGTIGNAMTAEFSAGVASVIQSVNLTTYDVQ